MPGMKIAGERQVGVDAQRSPRMKKFTAEYAENTEEPSRSHQKTYSDVNEMMLHGCRAASATNDLVRCLSDTQLSTMSFGNIHDYLHPQETPVPVAGGCPATHAFGRGSDQLVS